MEQLIRKPKESEVLIAYLKQCKEPPTTCFLLKFKDIESDQSFRMHFSWTMDTGTKYSIIRTFCYPYIKYHCSRRPGLEDKLLRAANVMNFGLSKFMYGLAATILVRYSETVDLSEGDSVEIYFMHKKDKGLRC